MSERTLRPLAFMALAGLAACSSLENSPPAVAVANPDPAGWRYFSGKPPTKAEFAALSATCEAKGGMMDACLTDLGLKQAK